MGKRVRGPIEQVPCPHCGDIMDLSEAREQLTGYDDRVEALAIECDGCHRKMRVLSVIPMTLVTVEAV